MSKEDTIQEIIEGLSRLHHPIDGAEWRKLGLSQAQIGMLFMVWRRQQLTSKQIANHLNVSQSAVSQLIDPLLDKGLVNRQTDPKDRRISRLHLTQKGLNILKKIRKLKTAGLRAALESLSTDEIKKLEKTINKMCAQAGK